MAAPNTFKIGLVQMRCAADPARQPRRARVARVREAADARREDRLPAGAVPHRTTSARRRTTRSSTWPSRSRARRPRRSAQSRARRGVVIVASLFERRAAGVYHNTAVVLDADGELARHATARCTSPTIRSTTRSSTSRPATSASARSTRASARVGTLVCWDQWYPEAARLTALAGAEMLFYPTAIGWHPAREGRVRRGAARRPGRRCSARTRSPTASTSRR